MKIIFWGTSQFAVPALETLVKSGYEILAVFTGQGPVKTLAQEKNIKIFQPATLKNDQIFEDFKNLNPDICVVAAYGKIIPERYLQVPKHGFVNIHPSLLPKYRGPSPIQTAIMNGDTDTGVSLMVIDKEMDHGPIISQKTYSIPEDQYYKTIEKDLAELGAQLLIDTLPKYISLEVQPQKQDHSQATFTKMLTRADSRIGWNEPIEKIYNLIRALNPEPGTWTTWNGKILNIKSSLIGIATHETIAPGTVTKVGDDIVITTERGYLIPQIVQLEGKKETNIKSLLNGYPHLLNSKLE